MCSDIVRVCGDVVRMCAVHVLYSLVYQGHMMSHDVMQVVCTRSVTQNRMS